MPIAAASAAGASTVSASSSPATRVGLAELSASLPASRRADRRADAAQFQVVASQHGAARIGDRQRAPPRRAAAPQSARATVDFAARRCACRRRSARPVDAGIESAGGRRLASTCIVPVRRPRQQRCATCRARRRPRKRGRDAASRRAAVPSCALDPFRRARSCRASAAVRSTSPARVEREMRAAERAGERELGLARRRAVRDREACMQLGRRIVCAARQPARRRSAARRARAAPSTGFMSGASRSAVRLPCWPALSKRMRPCAEKLAPPRSATDRFSICSPSSAIGERALASRAVKPEKVARSRSALSAISCGPSTCEPASHAPCRSAIAVSISSLGRIERGVELRRLLAAPHTYKRARRSRGLPSNAACRRSTAILSVPKRDVAAQLERLRVAARRRSRALQPGEQQLRIARHRSPPAR